MRCLKDHIESLGVGVSLVYRRVVSWVPYIFTVVHNYIFNNAGDCILLRTIVR